MINGMASFSRDWDQQVKHASNDTWVCQPYAEFIYSSRDTIQREIGYAYGNMTSETDSEGFGSIPWLMSYVNKAAMLNSAHVYIHSGLSVMRGECFQDPAIKLMFFVMLRRVHNLASNQLKYLWYVFQNTADIFRGAASQWMRETANTYKTDVETMQSVYSTWNPPNVTLSNRTDDDLPIFNRYDAGKPGVFNIVELLRRDTFNEWNWDKELVKVLMRHIFTMDDTVLELGAGTGKISTWLNETGWVTAYPYEDAIEVDLVTFFKVPYLNATLPPMLDGSTPDSLPYDWTLCISQQCAAYAGPHWEGIKDMTVKGLVMSKEYLRGEDRWPTFLENWTIDDEKTQELAEYGAGSYQIYKGKSF